MLKTHPRLLGISGHPNVCQLVWKDEIYFLKSMYQKTMYHEPVSCLGGITFVGQITKALIKFIQQCI